MLRRNNLNWLEIVFIIMLASFFSCVLFWRALSHPEGILHFSDAIHVWYFFKTFTVNSLKHFGELPLWNPLIYSGVPFAGNPQATLFYPPSWISFIVPVHYAITLLFTGHLAFAAAGMYFFAKKRRLSFGVSIFVCLVFVLNFKIMAHVFAGHLSPFCSWSYMPWLLLAVEYFLECRQLRSTVVLALCVSMTFLAGHLQIFFYQMLIASVYMFFLVFVFKRKETVGIIIGYILSLMLFILFTAVTIFPVMELMNYFHRTGGTSYEFAASFSLSLKDLITFLIPYFYVMPEHGSNVYNNFFWERTIYCGIIPLILLFLSYRRRQKYHSNFFIILLIFTLLFAMGDNGFLFKILYKFLPGISYFRCPSRMFLFSGFAVAVLSGYALQNIIDDKYLFSVRKLYRLSFAVGLVFIIANELIFFFADKTIPGFKYTIIYTIVFSFILYLWAKNYISKFLFLLFIIGLTVYDLGSRAFPLIKTVPLTEIIPKSAFYNGIINDNTVFRVYDACGAFPQYLGAVYGIHQIGGDDPVILYSYLNFMERINKPADGLNDSETDEMFFPVSNFIKGVDWKLLHFLNLKYIISSYKIPADFLILEESEFLDKSETRFFEGNFPFLNKLGGALRQKIYLYRNTKVMPRMFLLELERDNESIDEVLDRCLISPVKKYTPVNIIDYQPNKIVLDAQAETPCYLVTSEVYYPGWKAVVNGTETEILKIENLFRGILLEKGKHNVIFSYYPNSYKTGKTVSSSVLFLMIITYFFRKILLKKPKK